MDYKEFILKNGLKTIFVPQASSESSTVMIWVKTGSRFEGEKVSGISHFLEHIVFKGTTKRPGARIISETVDSFGGEMNAGTSKEWTNFYIKARNDKMDIAFDVLSDMVLDPLLKPNEIEKEKGVIIQEIAMYEDMPMIKIGDYFENLIYGGSSLGRDIAGTPDSVSGITRQDFIEYRKSHYYPSNMLLTIAGGVSEIEAKELSEKYFGKIKGEGKFVCPKEEFSQDKPIVKVVNKKTDQAHVILGFRGYKYGAQSRYIESVLSAILMGGMSSRMFSEVREKRGLAYAVKSARDSNWDNGYFGVYAGLKPDKTHEAIKVMLDQFYGITANKYKIGQKELTKAKEYLKGHLALGLEDTREICDFVALDSIYTSELRSVEEIYNRIDKVKVEEIYEVTKSILRPKNMNLAVVGPFKDTDFLQKLFK